MNPAKKEGAPPMQVATAATKTPNMPEPGRDESNRVMLQAEVDRELAEAIEEERQRHKNGQKVLTRRAIIEWGLKTWLLNVNPAKAKKLGISTKG